MKGSIDNSLRVLENHAELDDTVSPVDFFSEALNANDLITTARTSREEAGRYRGAGDFNLARALLGTATHVLSDHIDTLETETSSPEYNELNQELADTFLLLADVSATQGDFSGIRDALEAAGQVRSRLSPDQRADLTQTTKELFERTAKTGSFHDKMRAKLALRSMKNEVLREPEAPEAVLDELKLAKQLASVDASLSAARTEPGFEPHMSNFNIANDWASRGDERSLEAARLVAVHRISPENGSNGRSLTLLLLCAYKGNKQAAYDALRIVHQEFAKDTTPQNPEMSFELGDAFIASVIAHDEGFVDEVAKMASVLRESRSRKEDIGLDWLETALAVVKEGEWNVRNIPGIESKNNQRPAIVPNPSSLFSLYWNPTPKFRTP